MHTVLMNITPKQASEYLNRNTSNRPLRLNHVKTLANAMRRGEFVTTHQGVAFSKDGRLLDGQHRLHAIIQAGIPQKVNVTFDLEENAFEVIDTGIAVRSVGDSLGIDQKCAEVVNSLGRLMFDKPTRAQLRETYEIIGATTNALLDHCNARTKVFTSTPMKLAAVTRVFAGESADYVFDLYRSLALGHLDSLPPIGKSLVSQQVRGQLVGNEYSEILARGLIVFTKKNANNTRVQVKDPTLALEGVRQVFKKHFE